MRATLLVVLGLLATGSGARAEGWRHFRIILWQTPTATQIPALKRLGVETTKLIANRSGKGPLVDGPAIAPLLAGGMRWYVENIATDFYSAYHRWRPHVPVNAAFLAAQRAHGAEPASLAPFIRQPSLSDPAALAAITTRLRRTVRAWAPYRPLYYSLGDESGIADLAANWDFDFSPVSLAGFRAWLHGRYPSLAALNAEWGTHYAHWDAVTPITTTAAMARTDDNFAPWSDFKGWMDTAFASAIRAGTDAVHAADPEARAAIEGAQIAGWGGYDYAKLAGAADVMEIYDAGANLAMARSFNPRLILLTTAAESGPVAIRDIWQEALRGTRGLI
ncbi:MAG: beta-galactosidase, partial [Acetobacteraceae bacterium]